MADLPWCVSSCQSLHVFVLNDSVIQGSLNNHCSNTLDTPGVQINIKKIVTCFVIDRKPSKGKTKGILLGKLIFIRERNTSSTGSFRWTRVVNVLYYH